MTIDLSHLAPYTWILAAVLVIILVIAVIRFFWQHILKYLLQGCLVIIGIIALLAVLHYYFKLF
jgi:DNA integrity scanning protein DisA with diadenylate cyclase activity